MKIYGPLHIAFSSLELGPTNFSQFILPIFIFLVPQSETPLDAVCNSIPVSRFRISLQKEIHGIHIVPLVFFSFLRDICSVLPFVQHPKNVVHVFCHFLSCFFLPHKWS